MAALSASSGVKNLSPDAMRSSAPSMSKAAMLLRVDSKLSLSHVSSSDSSHATAAMSLPATLGSCSAYNECSAALGFAAGLQACPLLGLVGDMLPGLHAQDRCQGVMNWKHQRKSHVRHFSSYLGGKGRLKAACQATFACESGDAGPMAVEPEAHTDQMTSDAAEDSSTPRYCSSVRGRQRASKVHHSVMAPSREYWPGVEF